MGYKVCVIDNFDPYYERKIKELNIKHNLKNKNYEAFCNSFMYTFGLPIVILRYFTVYGPRQRPDMAIYKFFRLISEGQQIQIYGDDNQTRDFTFLSDIVDGTIKATESDVTGTFNLGSGKRISINNLIKIIENVTGKKVNNK
jgi:nucleoside-diphosphate-sugar epimerase